MKRRRVRARKVGSVRVEEGKSELDKVLEGSSYELGLYISNEVLRGEVSRLREELGEVEGST